LSVGILYYLTGPWPDTPDGFFHLQRVRALAEALRWGVIYPRWFPDFAFGYGYPVLNFYAPLFYYPPALLHLAGLDVITATRVTLAVGYGLSAGAMYFVLRRWWRPDAAFVGSVLYLTYPYRLYDVFVRGALPEFFAFVWLPWVLDTTLTLLATWTRPDAPGPRRWLALTHAALAWSLLLLTHNLTAWMTALTLAVGGTLWTLRRVKQRWPGGIALGGALLLGVALGGFYVIPAWGEMRWVGIGQGDGGDPSPHLISPTQMFTTAPAYPYPAAADPTVPTPVYVVVLLGAAAILAGTTQGRLRSGLLWGVGASVVYLWLSTTWSVTLWDKARFFLSPLQFPWRWYTLLTLALAVLIGGLWERMGHYLRPRGRMFLALGISVYFSAYAWGQFPMPDRFLQPQAVTVEAMWAFDAKHGQVGATWTAEFLPRWVSEQRWAIGRPPTTTQNVPRWPVINTLELTQVTYLGFGGRYTAARDTWLTLHMFYYPAWRVEVDGQPVETRPTTNLGLLSARLPAGEHRWRVRWGPTPAVWWGRGLTALGWLVIAAVWAYTRWERWRVKLLLWILTGGILWSGLTGWLERGAVPLTVNADYGPLVLTAANVTYRSGTAMETRLFWFIRQPAEPLTAFVHLVDASGRIVAQHDGPLGTPYTPPSRWLPNFLVPDPHVIPLSDEVRGKYRLYAGLYRPGVPFQPLRADRTDRDGRVFLGEVEVPR